MYENCTSSFSVTFIPFVIFFVLGIVPLLRLERHFPGFHTLEDYATFVHLSGIRISFLQLQKSSSKIASGAGFTAMQLIAK